jgi:hypothetical protein
MPHDRYEPVRRRHVPWGSMRIDDHGQPLRITARTGCGAT